MARQKQPVSDRLKKALAGSREALYAIERATGVKRASMIRFLRGDTTLRLDIADKLAAYFRLELRQRKRRAR